MSYLREFERKWSLLLLDNGYMFFPPVSYFIDALKLDSTACSSSLASSKFCPIWESGTVCFCCSCGCWYGHGWSEPSPEDHRGKPLLSCYSRCPPSGEMRLPAFQWPACGGELVVVTCATSGMTLWFLSFNLTAFFPWHLLRLGAYTVYS